MEQVVDSIRIDADLASVSVARHLVGDLRVVVAAFPLHARLGVR